MSDLTMLLKLSCLNTMSDSLSLSLTLGVDGAVFFLWVASASNAVAVEQRSEGRQSWFCCCYSVLAQRNSITTIVS